MKTVLIVDDETNLLQSLKEGFREHAGAFTIVTAENGAKASVILSSQPVDLVVTDLKMPVVDGFELMAYMSKHHPDIPSIIMTAHGTAPDIEKKLKLLDVPHYIRKPFDLEELTSAIVTELNLATAGHYQGLNLPAFLRLVANEKRTCTLSVEFGGESGTLYFNMGELIYAFSGPLHGDAAVSHMAAWDRAKIDISRTCAITEKNVSKSVEELLKEGRTRKEASGPVRPDVIARAPDTERAAMPAPAPQAEAPKAEIRSMEHEEHKAAVAASKQEGNMATTREILSELAKMQNIEAVCLVARDGFLLDSIARSGIDREMIGAIASSGFGASSSMGRQLDKGAMHINMIEFEKGPVMLSPIGEDAFLVIVADREANLGMIRLKLKKHSHELALAAAI